MIEGRVEVQIRRGCREPEPLPDYRCGMDVRVCPDCGAWSGRKDGRIDHEKVVEWVSLEDAMEMAKIAPIPATVNIQALDSRSIEELGGKFFALTWAKMKKEEE